MIFSKKRGDKKDTNFCTIKKDQTLNLHKNEQCTDSSRSQRGLKLILLVSLRLGFCCCQITKFVKLACRLPNYSNISPQGNNEIN